jgi:hypothetical protein
MEPCHQIIRKLMALMDETCRAEGRSRRHILKVQQQMKLAGLLQGSGGISVSIGRPGERESDEDIVARIKADTPVLRPDKPVPARPVL